MIKNTILSMLMLIISLPALAEEFDFRQTKTLYERVLNNEYISYENETILSSGGVKVKRKDLQLSDPLNINCQNMQSTILDSTSIQVAINTTLAAALIHSVFGAEPDKRKHAIYGTLIGYGAKKICENYIFKKDNKIKCALTGAGAALLAGLAKELYDSTGRGNVDAMDAVYTFVPGALISFSYKF